MKGTVFKKNYSLNKFLLPLFFAAVIIIAVDLGTDMAADRDEIGVAICILQESHFDFSPDANFLSQIDRPLLFEICSQDSLIPENFSACLAQDRAPPAPIV